MHAPHGVMCLFVVYVYVVWCMGSGTILWYMWWYGTIHHNTITTVWYDNDKDLMYGMVPYR